MRADADEKADGERKGRGDTILAVALLAIGAAMFLATLAFPPPGQPGDPGAAVFPRLIAVVFAVMAVPVLVWPERITLLPPKDERGRVAAILLLSLGYALLLDPLGFIIPTTLFMVGSLLVMGVRRVMPIVLTAVGVAVGLYLLFAILLDVYLPRGIVERVLL